MFLPKQKKEDCKKLSPSDETLFIRNKEQVGKTHKVLVEGVSKKSNEELYGRNSQNTVIVFPREYKAGDYVLVNVEGCTSATLKGKAIKFV